VDNAKAGVDTMERLRDLSHKMEVVAEQGGFELKETLMSEDKESADSELHKVLGLIWEMEADRL
jgi:hypothetical protein